MDGGRDISRLKLERRVSHVGRSQRSPSTLFNARPHLASLRLSNIRSSQSYITFQARPLPLLPTRAKMFTDNFSHPLPCPRATSALTSWPEEYPSKSNWLTSAEDGAMATHSVGMLSQTASKSKADGTEKNKGDFRIATYPRARELQQS